MKKLLLASLLLAAGACGPDEGRVLGSAPTATEALKTRETHWIGHDDNIVRLIAALETRVAALEAAQKGAR